MRKLGPGICCETSAAPPTNQPSKQATERRHIRGRKLRYHKTTGTYGNTIVTRTMSRWSFRWQVGFILRPADRAWMLGLCECGGVCVTLSRDAGRQGGAVAELPSLHLLYRLPVHGHILRDQHVRL